MTSIFLFRRDLRLQDNVGLEQALKRSKEVIPIFIFNPEQLENNPYRSEAAIQFMIQSLKDLDEQLKKHNSKLYCFEGEPLNVLKKLVKELGVKEIFANEDYTPFSRKRDDELAKKLGVRFFFDALLTRPESVLKNDFTPYTVYTPFTRKAKMQEVRKPIKNDYENYYKKEIKNTIDIDSIHYEKNENVIKGGRSEGLKLLNKLKELNEYTFKRDFPELSYTSKLSAHHKFGTISIRETYEVAENSFGKNSQFVNELFWRDFYTHIAYFFPYVFGGSFKKEFDNLKWENNKKQFDAWKEGKTGFPIIDAGMRELNKTGYMHNRVRMIVASFLVKDLQTDWRWGEKYFAQKLVDYDPSVNNGSWQWAASTGCDAQPYFRIFNPWLQQKKFDLNCEYIKKWVEELKDVDNKDIHDWEDKCKYNDVDYPPPIVDHMEQKSKTLKMFENI